MVVHSKEPPGGVPSANYSILYITNKDAPNELIVGRSNYVWGYYSIDKAGRARNEYE